MQQEMEARRQYYLDPSLAVTVRRQGSKSGPFKKNVQKEVKSHAQQNSYYSMEDLWTTKQSGGGKIKSSRVNKNVNRRKPVRF